jgi:acetyl-CoA C-acetyltransferase
MSHPLPAVRRVAIIGGNRIPFARSNTAYASASNQDMLTFTLQGLVDRFNLHGERLGEVAAGAVIKHSRDFNLTRESVLSRNPSLRRTAGLRHRPGSCHPRCQQDRVGTD